jgi:hypothetical protein
MHAQHRRKFLADVGKGMLVAGIGYATALDLELAPAWAAEEPAALTFGELEPLVRLMQDTAAEKLLPEVVQRLKTGTELRQLVAAAALANARTFGGQDYIGFHTMMALAPSYLMARESSDALRPLPVLKVLYRNAHRIQEVGGHEAEVLHPLAATGGPATGAPATGNELREAVRRKDMDGAEATFARIAQRPPVEAFEELLIAVHDESEVHRIVMPYRAWDLLDIVGMQHAHTMLRQSVRYCVQSESPQYREHCKGGRDVLPKLLDEFKLLGAPAGLRAVDDAWLHSFSETLFASSPEQAAEAAAAALAEGIAADDIGEAITLAANQLVLRDAGRPENQARAPEKPVGSIHGDSIGVHACDSANAWRNMARVGSRRNTVACLILGAYQVAFDRINRGGDFLRWQPYPTDEHRELVRAMNPLECLAEAEAAIRDNDQSRTCAAVERYAGLASDPQPVFDLLRRYSTTEDGALHAEKFFGTVRAEFDQSRAALRWRWPLALARVAASSHGHPAPGVAEARRLLAS